MSTPKNYTKLLNQLKAHKISHIRVTPDEFASFRSAFAKFPDRKSVIGTAHPFGQLVYHYNRN